MSVHVPNAFVIRYHRPVPLTPESRMPLSTIQHAALICPYFFTARLVSAKLQRLDVDHRRCPSQRIRKDLGKNVVRFFNQRQHVVKFFLLLFTLTRVVYALDPKLGISQSGHSSWRVQDGVLPSAPTAIAQTTDGYIWIGTENGLLRFDGIRFVPWSDFAPEKQLSTAAVSALLGGRDGSLWIGAGSRFYRWKDRALSEYANFDALVYPIIETKEGEIWFTRLRIADQDGPICHVQGLSLHCYGEKDGVPLPYAVSLAEDASGKFWIGSSTRLLLWQPGSSKTWTLKALLKSEGLDGMAGLVVDRNRFLWVGISRPGPTLGLEQFRDGVWRPFSSPQLDGTKIAVSSLFLDREGALWVGTDGQGIYRIVAGKVEHFDAGDGLTADKITGIFQDHEGTLWIATSKGIDSFRDLPIATFSKREGLHMDDARSVLPARDGTIWIGNDHALDALRNGVVASILPKDGLPGQQVTSLLEDREGGLWVGIDTGLFRFSRGKFVPVIKPTGSNVVFDMAYGADGSLWAVTAGPTNAQLVQIHNGHVKVWRTFSGRNGPKTLAADPQGRLWVAGYDLKYLQGSQETALAEFDSRYGYIRNIAVDGNDFVWFGATKGLIGFKDGRLQAMTAANGLPCERINTLIADNHHSLWLYAQCGLIRIDRRELDNWWRDPNARVKTTMFEALEGFQGAQSSFRPATGKSADGRLWFVNYSTLQTLDPDHLHMNDLPPPVQIERIIADEKSYVAGTWTGLPQLTRNIEIEYAALSFVVPRLVRFRYRLEGYDSTWQEAGSRRSAFYTKLGPGTYHFRVIACNNAGLWNETGANLAFTIPPAFTQTTWFKAICLLVLTGIVYSVYRLRIRQVSLQLRARMCERLAERERIARDLHDTFFQGIQGLLLRFHTATTQLGKDEPARRILEETLKQSDQVMLEGRELVLDLRATASEQNDLSTALADFGQGMRSSDSCNFRVVVNGAIRPLHPVVFEELFKIGKEAVSNAFRHSGAHSIEVELNYEPNELRVCVRDDGAGVEAAILEQGYRNGHFGLPGMRERAARVGASMEVWSRGGVGTEVEVRIAARIAYVPQRNGSWKLRRIRSL